MLKKKKMVRRVFSLAAPDLQWLQRESTRLCIPTSELLRRIVCSARQNMTKARKALS